MRTFTGQMGFGKAGTGRFVFWGKEDKGSIGTVNRISFSEAAHCLKNRYKSSLEKCVDYEIRDILSSYLLILEDPELSEDFLINSEKLLENSDDLYLKQRINDIRNIYTEIHALMRNEEISAGENVVTADSILCTCDVTPMEIARWAEEGSYPEAVILLEGQAFGHSAILLKNLNIPTIIGMESDDSFELYNGRRALVIGNEARLLVSENKEDECEIDSIIGKQVFEQDKTGEYAKVFSLESALSALDKGAVGIGLFRSEFLFMNRDCPPSEEEQFSIYKSVLERANGREVRIRTFDLGADKSVSYLKSDQYDTSPYSERGIRLSLYNREILKTQIRALLRSSQYGNLSVIYPMISDTKEISEIKELLNECENEFKDKHFSFRQGYMVETPESTMILDELCKEADFLCIGTNDLTYFMLKKQRGKDNISSYEINNSIELKFVINKIKDKAVEYNIPVYNCGEIDII